jgi:uncharacterized protein (TIGR02246 family)
MNETTDDDVKAVKRLGEEYFEASNVGDADRCVAMMTPDVIIMPPNRPSIMGTEQLRRLSREYHSTFELRYNLAYDEVETIGNFGFARSTVTGTRTSKADGSVEKLAWRNLWIVKRQADGNWKFWRIMSNSTIPSPAD